MSQEITVFDERGELTFTISTELKFWEEQVKKAEEFKKRYTEVILKNMEEKGIKKFENELIAITYIEPTTRVTLDSKRLKEEDFDTYMAFAQESNVKASVRIKCK